MAENSVAIMGLIGSQGFMSRDEQEYRFKYVVLLESGGIAQLAEHELCKLGVTGSIPVASTLGIFDFGFAILDLIFER